MLVAAVFFLISHGSTSNVKNIASAYLLARFTTALFVKRAMKNHRSDCVSVIPRRLQIVAASMLLFWICSFFLLQLFERVQ